MNAKSGKTLTKVLKVSCKTLMSFYVRLHGADSKEKVTLDFLLPAGIEIPRVTLTGTKEECGEVLRHFTLRVVTIPLDVMGHSFDVFIGTTLEHFGLRHHEEKNKDILSKFRNRQRKKIEGKQGEVGEESGFKAP